LKKICVIGSINMDLSFDMTSFPKPGETVLAMSLTRGFGGKGANQAIAAARLGGDVALCGVIGKDADGAAYVKRLIEQGVRTDALIADERMSTGVAIINVDNSCENTIIVYPGANSSLSRIRVAEMAMRSDADIFLLQLEVPLESVRYALRILRDARKTVILDPAPATGLPDDVFPCVDFITPNKNEIEKLSGIRISAESDYRRAGEILIARGSRAVIVKAGASGAYLIEDGHFEHFPAFPVKSVDTTGAGDSFNGAFAVALARNFPIDECIRYANVVGALTTRGMGAQESMPTEDETRVFVEG
jgi:ribokinase